MNCYAEQAIGSIRRELFWHVRLADAKELQFFLDEYRRYANTERPHQGIDGARRRSARTNEVQGIRPRGQQTSWPEVEPEREQEGVLGKGSRDCRG